MLPGTLPEEPELIGQGSYGDTFLIKDPERPAAFKVYHTEKNEKVHHDVKSDNLFLTRDFVLKLGDFGTMREMSTSSQNMAAMGTWRYLSPEYRTKKIISCKSDCYAGGLVCWEMIERRRVFSELFENHLGSIAEEAFQRNLEDTNPLECLEDFQQIVYGCTRADPSQRLDATTALSSCNKLLLTVPVNYYSRPVISHDQKELLKPIGFDGSAQKIPINLTQADLCGLSSTLVPDITFPVGVEGFESAVANDSSENDNEDDLAEEILCEELMKKFGSSGHDDTEINNILDKITKECVENCEKSISEFFLSHERDDEYPPGFNKTIDEFPFLRRFLEENDQLAGALTVFLRLKPMKEMKANMRIISETIKTKADEILIFEIHHSSMYQRKESHFGSIISKWESPGDLPENWLHEYVIEQLKLQQANLLYFCFKAFEALEVMKNSHPCCWSLLFKVEIWIQILKTVINYPNPRFYFKRFLEASTNDEWFYLGEQIGNHFFIRRDLSGFRSWQGYWPGSDKDTFVIYDKGRAIRYAPAEKLFYLCLEPIEMDMIIAFAHRLKAKLETSLQMQCRGLNPQNLMFKRYSSWTRGQDLPFPGYIFSLNDPPRHECQCLPKCPRKGGYPLEVSESIQLPIYECTTKPMLDYMQIYVTFYDILSSLISKRLQKTNINLQVKPLPEPPSCPRYLLVYKIPTKHHGEFIVLEMPKNIEKSTPDGESGLIAERVLCMGLDYSLFEFQIPPERFIDENLYAIDLERVIQKFNNSLTVKRQNSDNKGVDDPDYQAHLDKFSAITRLAFADQGDSKHVELTADMTECAKEMQEHLDQESLQQRKRLNSFSDIGSTVAREANKLDFLLENYPDTPEKAETLVASARSFQEMLIYSELRNRVTGKSSNPTD
ncbi:unnamed protein product, partial [Mesorhabditis belari]|uniref:Protein kinase domain-containing protein n=1 Tax=Mesorhabditis belari TaxID=2138241 RepID=A0AAF3EBU1_9BILA